MGTFFPTTLSPTDVPTILAVPISSPTVSPSEQPSVTSAPTESPTTFLPTVTFQPTTWFPTTTWPPTEGEDDATVEAATGMASGAAAATKVGEETRRQRK